MVQELITQIKYLDPAVPETIGPEGGADNGGGRLKKAGAGENSVISELS